MKQTKGKKTKWFSWHLFPLKENKINSPIEIAFYAAFLVLCIWAYGKVNLITTHSYTVDVECLNAKDIKNKWDCKVIPSAAVKFCLPMTETYSDTTNNSVTFKTVAPNKQLKERFCFFLDYPIGTKNDCDSLVNVYHKYHAEEQKDSSCCLYYAKSTQSINGRLYGYKVKQTKDSVGSEIIKGKYVIKHFNNEKSFSQEVFNMISSSKLYNNNWGMSDMNGTSMSNPGWFAAFDISQAYYNINIESSTIDSLTLEVDFIGAADFSKTTPEPDMLTMSSMKFYQPEKIISIKKNGLKIHAVFKELENRQTMRLYVLTGLLSAIVGLFIRALYKFTKQMKQI